MMATQQSIDDEELQQMQCKPEDFGGMRAECVDNAFLYKVCHVAGDLLESASIVVRESGLTIQTTDPQAVAVVIMDLPAKMFSSYRCEGFIVAHVNMETLVNMLKQTGHDHSKFELTLEIHGDDPETMYIQIFDKKKKTTTNHTLKLWEPKSQIIYFDEAQFDHYRVVSSRALHEEINNLSHLVDPNKSIRVIAGNDLTLLIEDEYGDSATKFTQNKSPGYKVVKQHVDATAKDAKGNYRFFHEIVGLQQQQQPTPAKGSSAKAKKGKRGGGALPVTAAGAKRKKTAPASKRRKIDHEQTSIAIDEVPSSSDTNTDLGNLSDENAVEEADEEDELYLSAAKLTKNSQPLIEDDAQDDVLIDAPADYIEPVKLTLSLLLLKMIAKGLRLDHEVFLLIKNNYPVMFLQRVQEDGRVLIALAPKKLDDDAEDKANPTLNGDDDDAMDQLMSLPDDVPQ